MLLFRFPCSDEAIRLSNKSSHSSRARDKDKILTEKRHDVSPTTREKFTSKVEEELLFCLQTLYHNLILFPQCKYITLQGNELRNMDLGYKVDCVNTLERHSACIVFLMNGQKLDHLPALNCT